MHNRDLDLETRHREYLLRHPDQNPLIGAVVWASLPDHREKISFSPKAHPVVITTVGLLPSDDLYYDGFCMTTSPCLTRMCKYAEIQEGSSLRGFSSCNRPQYVRISRKYRLLLDEKFFPHGFKTLKQAARKDLEKLNAQWEAFGGRVYEKACDTLRASRPARPPAPLPDTAFGAAFARAGLVNRGPSGLSLA